MPLSDRKIKILQAIINDYIATAEPVGSRTIAKKYDLGISSATIRNEMSDLEEMGLIIQPHASAGRIPSDLGYRLYVDRLMKHKELDATNQKFLRDVIYKNISQIDYLMEETAKALSIITNYTTIVSEPIIEKIKLKQIRLIPLDSMSVMLIAVTEENFIKNHIIRTQVVPSDAELYKISVELNTLLQGRALEEADDDILKRFVEIFKGHEDMLRPVYHAIEKTVKSAERVNVHLSGTKNILAFPEFSDVNKAKSIFQTLEEKDVLVNLLESGGDGEMQIMIGNENSIEEMKDCSVITMNYKMGDNTKGTIGILGPTRMDYQRVISALNGMVKNIEIVLKNLHDNKNG